MRHFWGDPWSILKSHLDLRQSPGITRRTFYKGLLLAVGSGGFPPVSKAQSQTVPNILSNGGFEQDLSIGWSVNPAGVGKGMSYRSEILVHSGKYSLRLLPNKYNVDAPGTDGLELVQVMQVAPYTGQPVYFSGWLGAKAGGTAVLRLVALSSSGVLNFRQLSLGSAPGSTANSLVFRQDILDLPNDPDLTLLYVSCSVKGPVGLVTFDDITVSNDPSVTNWLLGQPNDGLPLSALITINTSTIVRRIPRTLYGVNLEWVGNGQGLWDPEAQQFNPELLNLTQTLGPTLLRFPGGLFANYYEWTNGVGSQQTRPVTSPGPVGYTSPNNFGTDEAASLADNLGGNLIITTNALTGTAQDAANWVGYLNNGSRRADYWEVGNEMYLRYPADPSTPYVAGAPTIGITPEHYADTFLAYAAAMRAADPTIKIGADTEYNFAASAFRYYPDWAQVVLQKAGSQIDFLSVHDGLFPGLSIDAGWDVRTVYAAFLSAPLLMKQGLASLGQLIETAAGDTSGRIRIGITEWGPLFQTDPSSRFIDHVKTLGSALFAASAIKVMIEDPRVDVGCAFKLVDASTQGWIGVRQNQYVAKAPYYVLRLFTNYFGPLLVATNTQCPGYDTRTIGWAEAVQNAPYLDVVSSLSDDQLTLYVIAVNKHFDRGISAEIHLPTFFPDGTGTAWTLSGTALDANTGTDGGSIAPQAVAAPDGRFNQGGPGEITLTQADLKVSGNRFLYEFPARSVTALVIPGANG
jgi:alpha-N-arabinofuranosidase